MKIISSFALALFLSSAKAFGPASPLNGNAFGASSQTSRSAGDMTMRIGKVDMARKQRFNDVLKQAGSLSSKEAVQETLLSPAVDSLIQKSNWKLRKVMIRKVRSQASKCDVEVPAAFGIPPTQAEREVTEVTEGAARKAEKAAYFAGLADKMAAEKAARKAKKAEKSAKAAAALAARKGTEAPAAAVKKEEAAAPAKVEAAAAPAPAAASTTTGGPVTPATIKELRDATGAGMMDCKKALLECNGDQEAAAEYLRTKGLAKADKKASRIAAEGKIAVSTEGGRAVMVEVNCETDFVGKDASFLEYCDKVASAAIKINDDSVETLMSQQVGGETLEEARQAMVAKIGENIQVRRLASGGGDGKTVGCYVHMNRIGVLVELEGGSESVAMDVAMHVAAMNPPYATADQVPAEVLAKEKEILSAQALESGKPAEIVEKMVEGRIRKYLEEICLVSQNFVKNGDITVGKYLEQNGAKMVGFKRIAVGEGIEKKQDDFAAEVAKMAGTAA